MDTPKELRVVLIVSGWLFSVHISVVAYVMKALHTLSCDKVSK